MFVKRLLMARPLQLHLVLNESYPTRRYVTQPFTPFVIQDMPQMANFVYSYYMEKVKVLKDYYKTQLKWTEPGSCEVKEHEGPISSHPGEDRDTDSEEEGEEKGEKPKQFPVPIQDEDVGGSPKENETHPEGDQEEDDDEVLPEGDQDEEDDDKALPEGDQDEEDDEVIPEGDQDEGDDDDDHDDDDDDDDE